MSAPGRSDILGDSSFRDFGSRFTVPVTQPPEKGAIPICAGSRSDMGAVVLSLVSNWFINGETILVDGGVRLIVFLPLIPHITVDRMTIQTMLVYPNSF